VENLIFFTEKIYDNEKGYMYIPAVWRAEFHLHTGTEVGIDYNNDFLVIDKETSREYTQKISSKGNLTIPLKLREKIHNDKFYILIEQRQEKIILAPAIK
jgi:bifunctional DNA-binding transcriptional regulator/antitoxin component of YhaV-PrlF toxin-antitoxin module